MLSDLLDPTNLDQLKGEGDIKTLLMVLQSQSSIVSDSAVLLIEEENLLGEEPEKMTEAEFLQTKAVQKGEVSFGIESWLAIRKRLFFCRRLMPRTLVYPWQLCLEDVGLQTTVTLVWQYDFATFRIPHDHCV